MPKVMLTVTYAVRPEMRERYLDHVRDLQTHLRNVSGKNYSVFELKSKQDMFSEVFLTESMEEFDSLEDNQDELTQNLLQRIEECTEKGTKRYATFVGIE